MSADVAAVQRALCVVCDNRTAVPGTILCKAEITTLRERLLELSSGYTRLDPAPGSSTSGGRGAPGFGSRSPARDQVLALTDARARFDPTSPCALTSTLAVVSWWADQAREDGLVPPRRGRPRWWGVPVLVHGRPAPRTVQSEVGALLGNLGRVTAAWWAPDMVASVAAALVQLREGLGELEDTIPLGEHPGCGGQVRAPAWGRRARCTGCGMPWEGEAALRLLAERLGDAEMDAPGLARYCGVEVPTIRVWAHRYDWERIRRGGRTLYRVSDARAAVIRTGTRLDSSTS